MSWFGRSGQDLARQLDLPRVEARPVVDSTMDVAHALAADGAPAGTLVLAEAQQAGRGRVGKRWQSESGAGLWLTLVERPRDASALGVLSLRIGLRLAPVLERWTVGSVRLKWPNDLFVGAGKLAGVLVETRWRGTAPDWVAIGLGINLRAPAGPFAGAALRDADPGEVLAEVIPALRAAAFAEGPLSDAEVADFASRDLALGQRIAEPADGRVRGIAPSGELLVETAAGVTPVRSGSLIFAPTEGL